LFSSEIKLERPYTICCTWPFPFKNERSAIIKTLGCQARMLDFDMEAEILAEYRFGLIVLSG
jgi:hypothetical protein